MMFIVDEDIKKGQSTVSSLLHSEPNVIMLLNSHLYLSNLFGIVMKID